MKVRYGSLPWDTLREEDLDTALSKALSETCCDGGAIERLHEKVDNVINAFSQLTNILVDKGVITLDDINREMGISYEEVEE